MAERVGRGGGRRGREKREATSLEYISRSNDKKNNLEKRELSRKKHNIICTLKEHLLRATTRSTYCELFLGGK